MSNEQRILIITASDGKNLELAKRFKESAENLGHHSEVLDLTTINLPLYNPKTHREQGIPELTLELNKTMTSYSHWVICAPEYNGSIPPVFTSALAWLSVKEDDFRSLFNGRPIAMATFSGGGGMELLMSLRIQLTHLGAQVVGRQLLSNYEKKSKDQTIEDLLIRLTQMQPLKI